LVRSCNGPWNPPHLIWSRSVAWVVCFGEVECDLAGTGGAGQIITWPRRGTSSWSWRYRVVAAPLRDPEGMPAGGPAGVPLGAPEPVDPSEEPNVVGTVEGGVCCSVLGGGW